MARAPYIGRIVQNIGTIDQRSHDSQALSLVQAKVNHGKERAINRTGHTLWPNRQIPADDEALRERRDTMKHISIGRLNDSRLGLGAMSMAGYSTLVQAATRSRSAPSTGRSTSASRTSTLPRSTVPA